MARQMSKSFLNLKNNDIVVVCDEYAGGSSYHTVKINGSEDDKGYVTETNPRGRIYFCTDQEYVNDIGEFEEGDNEYISILTEGNFVYVVEEGEY